MGAATLLHAATFVERGSPLSNDTHTSTHLLPHTYFHTLTSYSLTSYALTSYPLPSYTQVRAIFKQYSKSGGPLTERDGPRPLAVILQAELHALARDVCLATESFPMARVQSVFSAQRTDRADGGEGGQLAKAAEPADGALELHEFLEALVRLSFSRANPWFGEAGHERDAPNPLPECLEQMLQKNLMPTATRERLWTWREGIIHEATVQVVLWSFKPQLTRHYERLVGGGPIDASDSPRAAPAVAAVSPTKMLAKPGNGVSQLPVEVFLHDLTARKIIRELTVRPLSGVAGTLTLTLSLSLTLTR